MEVGDRFGASSWLSSGPTGCSQLPIPLGSGMGHGAWELLRGHLALEAAWFHASYEF